MEILQKESAVSHAFTFIALHLVFSTKGRNVAVPSALLPQLHAVIGNLINTSGARTVLVGGTRDHVHAAFILERTTKPADLVRDIKHKSSRWLTSQPCVEGKFEWQSGYSLFSVGPSQIDILKNYIRNQEEHHRFRTFDHEMDIFLKRYADLDHRACGVDATPPALSF